LVTNEREADVAKIFVFSFVEKTTVLFDDKKRVNEDSTVGPWLLGLLPGSQQTQSKYVSLLNWASRHE
jgi:hypothetical protein